MKILQKIWKHAVAVVLFVLVSVIYFLPQLQGKVIQSSDTIVYEGMSKEIKDYNESHDDVALWTNSMFGGMPAYQIHVRSVNNILVPIVKSLRFFMGRPAGLFISGMICFYIMLITLKIDPWVAIVSSIAFGLTTNSLVLFQAGHMTKIATIMVSPLVISGVLLAYRSEYLKGGIIFAIGMGLNLMSNHPQMTYYLGLFLGIFVLIKLAGFIKENQIKVFAKASGVLLLGLVLAFMCNAPKLWTTYEYGKDTMRGAPILETEGIATTSSETEGLEWQYAMRWSNGWSDFFSSYIPLAVGGSSGEVLSKDSNVAKILKQLRLNVRRGTNPMPLYWGGLPSTSGPIYFGAIIFFLFVLGSLVVKGSLKWWLVGVSFLSFLLSLGINFEEFNRFIFDNIPLYNKFRTPNSILTVTSIFIPFLAATGLHKFLYSNDELNKQKVLLISFVFVGGSAIILGLFGPYILDFSNIYDSRRLQIYQPYLQSLGLSLEDFISALEMDRMDLLRSSAVKVFFLVAFSTILLFLYIKKKIPAFICILAIGVLSLIDLVSTGKRYLNHDSFITKKDYNEFRVTRPVDAQILQDTDPYYRVHDMTIDLFQDSRSSYYHKTVGGMHAAKLQRIDDMYYRHIAKGNQKVLNMLNTKYYIINDDNGRAVAQRNPAALGNSWFINNINIVENANAEIDALNDFDPAGDVIIHQEFSDYVVDFNPTKSGSISLVEYSPNKLTYKTNTDAEQFAVFSEVWYGPDKGWTSYIDGKEVDHIRVNYLLRGMKVPAGNHEIVFEFKPRSYYLGKTIGLIGSILLVLFTAFGVYRYVKDNV